MKEIYLASIVRNGMAYLPRWQGQTDNLRAFFAPDYRLRLVLGYGDCEDETPAWAAAWAASHPDNETLDVSHGGPAFGSIDDPTRWAQIAGCWNRLFDALAGRTGEALIYVEADLIWDVVTMLALISWLHTREDVDGVAPMSMHRSGFFYDTWGHRRDGAHFSSNPPYHPALALSDNLIDGLSRIDSAGSCKALAWPVVRDCRFSSHNAMIGPDMAARGYRLWLDPTLSVYHP